MLHQTETPMSNPTLPPIPPRKGAPAMPMKSLGTYAHERPPAPRDIPPATPPAGLSLDDARKFAQLCTEVHHQSPSTVFTDLGRRCCQLWPQFTWYVDFKFTYAGEVTCTTSLQVLEKGDTSS